MPRSSLGVALAACTLAACGPKQPPSAAPVDDPAPAAPRSKTKGTTLNDELTRYVADITADLDALPAERREALDALADFIRAQREAGGVARLTFICTHNSRRSQMAQVWAAVAASYYGVDRVESFSGGTETTAFNPRAVSALRRAGFRIDADDSAADNPHYTVSFGEAAAIEAFSKTYDDAANPTGSFAAVMTCSDADQACPFVRGAALRLAVPYVDPKVSDGTAEEDATYDARARQIATEMFYVLSRV